MGEYVKEINDTEFEKEVLKSEQPVLVDLWAPWCGPCKMVTPIIEDLAADYSGDVAFYKINIDDNPGTAGDYGVTSIPTILFFKDGEELSDKRMIGAQSKDAYQEVLDDLV